MFKQGRDAIFSTTSSSIPSLPERRRRAWAGQAWWKSRVADKVAWERADEAERDIIPRWGGREVGAFTFVGAVGAAADRFLNQFGPPGADAASFDTVVYRRPKGLLVPWLEGDSYATLIAQVLMSIIIVIFTGVFCYYFFKFANRCDTFIRSKINFIDDWWSKDRVTEKPPEIKIPKQKPNKIVGKSVRDVGVQSQCHYSWHANTSRFIAREQGFSRAGEVTIGQASNICVIGE